MTVQKISLMLVAALTIGGVRTPLAAQESPGLPGFPLGLDAAAAGDDGEAADEDGGGLRGVFKFFAKKGSGALSLGTDDVGAGASGDGKEKKILELMQLSNLNIANKRIPEAMRNVNELIGLKPYDPEVHLALGLCYRRLGRHDEAQKKYQDVLDLGGPKGLISLLMAEAFAIKEDRESALSHMRDAAMKGRNIINDVGLLPSLRKYRDDTEFIKLALQLEKVEIEGSLKHDPFTNPFPRRQQEVAVTGVEIDKLELTPEEQGQLLSEAKKAYTRVLFYVKLEDEEKAMMSYNQLRDLFAQKELVTVPKIAHEFSFLEGRMEELEVRIEGIRLKFYYNQAKEKIEVMKENFLDGEYQAVAVMHDEIVKLTDEMVETNEQYKSVAERILQNSLEWVRRAEVREEFSERKPRIQGIVIGEDGKMAVLNDRVVKQGEAIQEFRVVKVESNRVTFRYKGEEIPLVFRRY